MRGSPPAGVGTAGKPSLAQLNMMARQAVLGQAIEMTQSIYSNTIATPGSSANTLNIIPRNVGMIKRFTVEVLATLTNTGATTCTTTNFNVANILSQIVFNDLNNLTRIQTTGWHMNMINTVRNPRDAPFGSSITNASQDVPIKWGANYTSGSSTLSPGLFLCPATIAASGSAVIKMTYEIPLAYSDDDLRGAVYANVVNATMLLQLTLNPAPVVAATADNTLAIFSGTAAAGSIVSATVNVYQTFLDQLPNGKNGPVLPVQDLSTVYELKNTSLQGMSQNQDFPVPYSNFRDFLSTCVIWDNGGTLAPASATADAGISYWALQSANFTNIWKLDPYLAMLWVRKKIGIDPPAGAYYFDHRRKPLSTIQYGNLELIMNDTATVNSGAQLLIGYEDFGLINTISGAGSLAAG